MRAMMSVWFALFAVLAVVVGAGTRARAEDTRATYPDALVGEVLGRGGLFSVGYDRVLDPHLAAGVSYGQVGLKTTGGADAGRDAQLLPVYVNYYLTQDQGSVFGTAGATVVLNSSDAQGLKGKTGGFEFNSSAVVPTVGVGYESRGDTGFLFRATAYANFAEKVAPWFGFSFGKAF